MERNEKGVRRNVSRPEIRATRKPRSRTEPRFWAGREEGESSSPAYACAIVQHAWSRGLHFVDVTCMLTGLSGVQGRVISVYLLENFGHDMVVCQFP